MKHFFADGKAYKIFKTLRDKLPGDVARTAFYGHMSKAFHEKQNSERDDLSSYALTAEEVQAIHTNMFATSHQN